MLTQGESIETASANENAAAGAGVHATEAAYATAPVTSRTMASDPDFPRSMTMRWIMDHPFYTAAAVVGAAMLIPKAARVGKRAGGKLSRRKRNKASQAPASYAVPGQPHVYPPSPQNAYPQTVYIQQPPPPSQKTGALAGVAAFGGTALTSIITIATMILRDPAKMQMAMRMFSTASDYMHKRRSQQNPQSGQKL
jgi:hypothetical protein